MMTSCTPTTMICGSMLLGGMIAEDEGLDVAGIIGFSIVGGIIGSTPIILVHINKNWHL